MSKQQEEAQRMIGEDINGFMKDREAIRKHLNFVCEFYNISPEKEEKVKGWLVDVLEAAKGDTFPALWDLDAIVMAVGGCCRRDAHAPSGDRLIEKLQIILPDLSNCDEQSAKFAISRLLGHAILYHWKIRNRKVSAKVCEVNDKAADILAASWGFVKREK